LTGKDGLIGRSLTIEFNTAADPAAVDAMGNAAPIVESTMMTCCTIGINATPATYLPQPKPAQHGGHYGHGY